MGWRRESRSSRALSHRGFLTNLVPLRFLSYVDLLGTTYSAPSLATGYGNHLAQPLLRRALEKLGPEGHKLLEEADARKIIENAMKVLFYRDARSLNKVSRAGNEGCSSADLAVRGAVPNCDGDRARCGDFRAHVGADRVGVRRYASRMYVVRIRKSDRADVSFECRWKL